MLVIDEPEALTVDLKERCRDASPRGIYEELGVGIYGIEAGITTRFFPKHRVLV